MLLFIFPPAILWFILPRCLRWRAGHLRLPTGSDGRFRCSAASLPTANHRRQREAVFRLAGAQCAPLHSCCGQEASIVRTPPVDDSVPFTGRQPELEYYQSPRPDARRAICSRGSAALHLQACPKIPRRGHAAGITEKGVQNRRFWCVFGYFCHRTKVTAGPGRGAPRYRTETAPPTA